jgi:hypothetical protein
MSLREDEMSDASWGLKRPRSIEVRAMEMGNATWGQEVMIEEYEHPVEVVLLLS